MSDLNTRLFERANKLHLLSALPRLSGLSRGRVEAIRAGDEMSVFEYERLCRAVAIDPVILYRRGENDPRRSPARFRAAEGAALTGEDWRLLALATEVGAVLGYLANQLGRPTPLVDMRAVKAVGPLEEAGRSGYELGEAARLRLTLHDRPIESLLALLTRSSVHVVPATFSTPRIDAASLWMPDSVPVILVNTRSERAQHPGALRATLAHELCHLLHDAGEQDLTTVVSWGEGRGNYNTAIEARARGFAPAFLAPRPAVVAWASTAAKDVDDEVFIAALAHDWGLSFEGAAWHAKNCHLIDDHTARRLARLPAKPPISYPQDEAFRSFSPSACHPDLPEKPAPLWDGLAAELVCAALHRGHLSPGRARELLTWS